MDSIRDSVNIKIKGVWWDEWWEPNENGILVCTEITRRRSNTKMDNAALLVSALFAKESGIDGILQHAQGLGDGLWGGSPPAVTTSDTTLLDEVGRAAPDSIVFLTGPGGGVSGTRTTTIKISTTYGLGVLAGETLREQGLFGGDATNTPDSGIIIDVIRHGPIYKSGGASLVRNIELTFS
jgi:hypothetical protein